MAEKTKMTRRLAADPLLPAVRVEKKQPPPPQQQQQEDARASPPFPAVLLVSLWGFLNAGFVTLGLVIFLVLSVINPCSVPSWMLPTIDESRDAAEVAVEDAKVTALLLGYMWCTVAQATAVTPALLLGAAKRRRWMWIRRVLACAVLAAAADSHCMFARVLTTSPPGRDPIVFRITNSAAIFVFAVGDLLCLLALLVELWEATTRG